MSDSRDPMFRKAALAILKGFSVATLLWVVAVVGILSLGSGVVPELATRFFARDAGEMDLASVKTMWPTRDPEAAGLDRDKLGAFRRGVGEASHGAVIKNGELVYVWGEPDLQGDWGSATKPVFSTLLFFAVQEGRLPGVDARVADHVQGLRGDDERITFRHVANMTSGYSLQAGPGECWAYNDYGIKLKALALFEGVFGISAESVAEAERLLTAPERLEPLSFEGESLFTIEQGIPRLVMTPLDFARVGQLWMDEGTWEGDRLLQPRFFQEFVKADVPRSLRRCSDTEPTDYLQIGTAGGRANMTRLGPGHYGFHWWFNTERGLWPDVPADAFQANGHWNREALTVIPSLRIVAAWIGGEEAPPDQFGEPMNETLKLLVEAASAGDRPEPAPTRTSEGRSPDGTVAAAESQ